MKRVQGHSSGVNLPSSLLKGSYNGSSFLSTYIFSIEGSCCGSGFNVVSPATKGTIGLLVPSLLPAARSNQPSMVGLQTAICVLPFRRRRRPERAMGTPRPIQLIFLAKAAK